MTTLGLISHHRRKRYMRQLREVLAYCMDHDAVAPFRYFIRRWIREGAPIDPAAYWAPKPSLKIVIRQVVSAMPGMGAHHVDAMLWLTEPEARAFNADDRLTLKRAPAADRRFVNGGFKPYTPGFVPWNLHLYAPRGSPYDAFNRIGFTLEQIDD